MNTVIRGDFSSNTGLSNKFNSVNVINNYSTGGFRAWNTETPVFDERDQILEWLPPLTSLERHQVVRDTRMDGVGDWLLRTEMFSTWRKLGGGAAKPVLLCYGDPGVGKTYISSLVIDSLCDGIDGDFVTVTCMYCDFSAQGVQSVSTVLGSVLRQVVGSLKEIPNGVQEAFDHAKRQIGGRGLRAPEVLKLLIRSLSSLKQSFICIDSLDEFPLKHRRELWHSLQSIVRECPATRLFLTGRPYIRDEAREYFPTTSRMLQLTPSERDIGLYLRMRLDRDPERNAMDEGLRADILTVIPERISGIFLLASLTMDAILEVGTIHQRRRALQRMTNDPALHDAYNTTLDRINQQSGSKSRLGMEALMWISRCERPLRSVELCYALGVELEAEDFNLHNVPSIWTVLECTLGLVTIDERASTVRPLHSTLQEYLREHPTLFPISHSMMAEICLTFLNSPSVKALPANLDAALDAAPFLEYATCFWGTHASREMTEPVKSLALQLLDGYENHLSAAILRLKNIHEGDSGKDVQGISGLHCIAFWGLTEIAIAMLERKRWDLNGRDSRGDTPLIWAVRYRNDGMVALFLEQEDIEPNQPNRDGRTAFSLAAEWGNEGAVKLLLQHGGADSNSPDNRGRTPLSYAASGGHEVVVKLISDRTEFNPNSSPRNSRALPSYTPRYGYLRALGLLLGYENPASGSSGTHRPPAASVHGGDVPGQWVAGPPPALEDVTPNTAIDLALDASLSHSVSSRPPREPPLQLKQSPLNQLDSPSAVCTPSASGSGVGFLFFHLVSIMLFALAFRVFLVYSGYGGPYELFHTLNGAWRR